VKANRIFGCAVVLVLLTVTVVGVMTASGQKSSTTPSGAKLWMSAMDTDHDGTVSKEEFLTYMEKQFEKADGDHDGTLDRNEMEQLRKNLGIGAKQ
jgi:Ca2+-binding EF-hand superfamily protein